MCQSQVGFDSVTIHQATGQQAFFALDSGILPFTAQLLASLEYNVIVVINDDEATIRAAKRSKQPYCVHNNYRDWSDVGNNFGVDAVKFNLFAKVIGGLLDSIQGKLMVSRDQAL